MIASAPACAPSSEWFKIAALTKYVSLVGNVLAKASSRPDLKWEFIVLDTDGVNAFAAPGGLVHITKGALGLIKTESELAGVLGHEIAHITKKHTVNSIKRSKMTKMGTDEVGSRTNYLLHRRRRPGLRQHRREGLGSR